MTSEVKSSLPNLGAIIIWLVCGTVGYLVVFQTISASLFEGRYYPVYGDSFYHASRIFDVYRGAIENFHFDPNLNAPEGIWVSWPWLYDTAMAYLVKTWHFLRPEQDIEYFLFSIPSWWIYVNLGLITVLLFQFRVNVVLAGSALLCLAVSPSMVMVHSFGRVDHHFAELTMLLAVSIVTVEWLRNINSIGKAMICGTVLGIAPAIHNGLFVLYLPLLAALFVSWCTGRLALRWSTAVCFILSSVVVLLFLLVFSEPFWQGFFAFYYFGWFHLYIAGACSLVVLFLSWTTFTHRNLFILIFIGLLTLAPLLNNFLQGYEWVGADVSYLSRIIEMRPLFDLERVEILRTSIGLMWQLGIFAILLPLSFLAAVYFIWKNSDDSLVFLSFMFLLSVMLWMHQQRFEYFGVPALFLFATVAIDQLVKRFPSKRAIASTMVGVVGLVLISVPVLAYPGFLRSRASMGMQDYPLAVALLNEAAVLCEEDPGILLLETHFGHLARYLTKCPVISTMMLISPSDFEKTREMEDLLQSRPEEIAENRPDIKYVLVLKTSFSVPGRYEGADRGRTLPLVDALLDPDTELQNVEPIRLLNVRRSGRNEAYGGLFRFVR